MSRNASRRGSNRPFSILRTLVEKGEIRLAPETDKLLEPPRRVDGELPEEEAFRQAMSEVRPLGWNEAPLRLPAPVELPHRADDEGEALAQLKAFVNGRGDWDPFASGEGVEGAASRQGQRYLPRLRAGEFSVQAQLDLHGLRLGEARPVLERFLRDAVWKGHCCVRIVHGRGTHSPHEPGVLKTQVARWLLARRMRRLVVAFTSARWQDGGAGAVYVLLYRFRPSP
jgi:DNA-nicking Smr family endonuclease